MELERPVRSPHQIHISRIYFIGRRIGSLPNGRLRTGLPPRLSCGWRQSMSKNGSGIEPSDIDTRQIVPHDASAAATFEEQLDRHANIIARFGTEWADRLVEEADRLVEEAEAKRRAAVEFAEEIKRRASETAADLKAGFERIRAAGRALHEARRQFDLGRVP
jgi:hypothetical protein